MGFFDQFFGKNNEQNENKSDSFWKPIENWSDVELAIQESEHRKVLIFKHSTRCFISQSVLRKFEKQVSASDQKFSYYFLDLLSNRAISNAIADQFSVAHQSPQLIVLEKGKAVYHSSHDNISLDLIND